MGVRAVFLPGAVNHLPKNSPKLPKVDEKKQESCDAQHRAKYEVRIFLSYELIKHVERQPKISMVRSISLLTTELAYSFSMLRSVMLVTRILMVVRR